MIGLGVVVGLFLVANSGWVPVQTPPWLEGLRQPAARGPAAGADRGLAASAILLATIILWSMFYVWRRRQYESLINKLEKELAKLRNLPFTEPAPLEDLPETPSEQARARDQRARRRRRRSGLRRAAAKVVGIAVDRVRCLVVAVPSSLRALAGGGEIAGPLPVGGRAVSRRRPCRRGRSARLHAVAPSASEHSRRPSALQHAPKAAAHEPRCPARRARCMYSRLGSISVVPGGHPAIPASIGGVVVASSRGSMPIRAAGGSGDEQGDGQKPHRRHRGTTARG